MFEEEPRKKKPIFVTCGTSIMKEKYFMPQVIAMMNNYLSGTISMSYEEFDTMISYLTKWTQDKKKKIIDTMVTTGTLIKVDSLDRKRYAALFDTEALMPQSYTSLVGLYNFCRKMRVDSDVDIEYKGEQLKYVTISSDTLFALLEQQNDLLFKVYIYLLMNKTYWNDYKKVPYQMYIKGKGGLSTGLGYSVKSGSTIDRIRDCIATLENMGLVVLGEPISRGKMYGNFLGYYRPLLDVRDINTTISFKDYELLRVPNFLKSDVEDFIYDKMIAAGYSQDTAGELIFA